MDDEPCINEFIYKTILDDTQPPQKRNPFRFLINWPLLYNLSQQKLKLVSTFFFPFFPMKVGLIALMFYWLQSNIQLHPNGQCATESLNVSVMYNNNVLVLREQMLLWVHCETFFSFAGEQC